MRIRNLAFIKLRIIKNALTISKIYAVLTPVFSFEFKYVVLLFEII